MLSFLTFWLNWHGLIVGLVNFWRIWLFKNMIFSPSFFFYHYRNLINFTISYTSRYFIFFRIWPFFSLLQNSRRLSLFRWSWYFLMKIILIKLIHLVIISLLKMRKLFHVTRIYSIRFFILFFRFLSYFLLR